MFGVGCELLVASTIDREVNARFIVVIQVREQNIRTKRQALVNTGNNCTRHIYFYAPGLKGPPEASSNRIAVRLSVRLSVCSSVRNSVPLTIKVQYLKFGWWYNYQTWTVSSSKGCLHFTDITRPWGVGQGQNVGLRDFFHNWTLLPPGASVFHKHMSSFYNRLKCSRNTYVVCGVALIVKCDCLTCNGG